jgi:pilus assembly protein Flp/PilA
MERPMLKRFIKDASGVSAVEYGLIVAVLSLTIVAGVGMATNSLEFLFANNASKLQQTLGN